MALKFCPKCNHGTTQLDVQIKFCSQCGYNFISASMPKIEIENIPESRPQQRKVIARRQVEEEYYDEDTNNDNEFVNLDFAPPEIELDNLPSRPTIKGKDLALDTSPKEKIFREKNKLKLPKNKKQAEAQLDQELRNEFSRGGKRDSHELGGF